MRDSNAMCLYQWIWLANILLKICILHVVTKEELPYWKSLILHVIITTIKSKELKSIHSKHLFGQIYSHLKWTGIPPKNRQMLTFETGSVRMTSHCLCTKVINQYHFVEFSFLKIWDPNKSNNIIIFALHQNGDNCIVF